MRSQSGKNEKKKRKGVIPQTIQHLQEPLAKWNVLTVAISWLSIRVSYQ